MKKHNKFLRSLLAIVIAILMVGSVIPTVAFAADVEENTSAVGNILNSFEAFIQSIKDFFQRIIDFFRDLFGCKDDEIPVAVEAVTVDKAELKLVVGDADKITVTVTPGNADDKSVTFASDNEAVATVDADGNVTAIATGAATITATSNYDATKLAIVEVKVFTASVTTADDAYDSTLQSGKIILSNDIFTADAAERYTANREYAIRDDRDYTIDLNGHTINHYNTYQNGNSTGYTYLYTVAYNGKLTVNGEGIINSHNSEGAASVFYAQSTGEIVINGGEYNVKNGIAVWAGNGSHVTINGGSFISTEGTNEELIYSSGGVIDIYGGFFHNTGWEERPVNVANANRSTGFINIYGGTFVNFDPSTGGDDPNNIKVADGYKVVSEIQENGEIWYQVVKA